jgi:hypothetical protein
MKQILLISIYLLINGYCYSQELIKNETDEFTKLQIKETSFEPIVQNFSMSCFLSVKKIDSTYYLQAAITIGPGNIHFIEKDASFYLKLVDDRIVELKNIDYAISCKGCAYTGSFSGSRAEGTTTTYILSDENMKIISSSGIKKIRIYTSKGYVESEIKANRSNVLKNELLLF